MTIYDIKNEDDYHTRMADTNGVLVVIGFFAKWCQPCNAIAPKLRQLALELSDVIVLKIEADFCPNITKQFHITTVPTFFMMRDKKELEYISGSNYDVLKSCIQKHILQPLNQNYTEENGQLESKSIKSSDSLEKVSGTPIPKDKIIIEEEEKLETPLLKAETPAEIKYQQRSDPPIDDTKKEEVTQNIQPMPVVVDQLEKLKPALYIVENVSDVDDQLARAGNTLVILACMTTWCSPCISMTPELDKLSEEFTGSLIVLKADIDKCRDISSKYDISSLPTFVIIKEKQQLNRITGADQNRLRQCIVEFK